MNSVVFADTNHSNLIEKYSFKNQALTYLKDNILNPISLISEDIENSKMLKNKTIVIDPGHGGSNPGATKYGMRESDNNLSVGIKLKKVLEDHGAKVVMTRETDKTVAAEGLELKQELQARVDLVDINNADIFISLHTNANENANVHGAMTFYHNDISEKLADDIQKSLIKFTEATDKGTEKENFYVLRNNKVPAILVEMGFITNKIEADKLNSDVYRDELVNGIYDGIINYFND
ncbi:MAG: cell wall hydrolase/autolysin [Firmicutes bacterium]|nr:cell wall hydrolase/autolysin [Bacillota bacterium]